MLKLRRWYKLTPEERRSCIDQARTLFQEGKGLETVLRALALDPLDRSRVSGLGSTPPPAKPPATDTSTPPAAKSPRRRRDPAGHAAILRDEADDYQESLRELLPPGARAQLLVEAATSANPLMRAGAIKRIDEILNADSGGGQAVPLFTLPADTRLGFAPVVSQGQHDVEAEKARVCKVIQRYWLASEDDEESARWQACLAEVIGD